MVPTCGPIFEVSTLADGSALATATVTARMIDRINMQMMRCQWHRNSYSVSVSSALSLERADEIVEASLFALMATNAGSSPVGNGIPH